MVWHTSSICVITACTRSLPATSIAMPSLSSLCHTYRTALRAGGPGLELHPSHPSQGCLGKNCPLHPTVRTSAGKIFPRSRGLGIQEVRKHMIDSGRKSGEEGLHHQLRKEETFTNIQVPGTGLDALSGHLCLPSILKNSS